MKKTEKTSVGKISFRKMDKFAEQYIVPSQIIELSVGDETMIVEVKWKISFEDTVKFVTGVADVVAAEYRDGKFFYTPSAEDLAFKQSVLAYYTNIKTDTDIERVHNWLSNTSIYETVAGCIDPVQLTMLKDSVAKLIKFRLDTHKTAVLDKLGGLIDAIKNIIHQNDMGVSAADINQINEFISKYNANDVAEAFINTRRQDMETEIFSETISTN